MSNPTEPRIELVGTIDPQALIAEARADPYLSITVQYVGNEVVGEAWKITRQSKRQFNLPGWERGKPAL